MKRFLCVLMCLLMLVPTALAAEAEPTVINFYAWFDIEGWIKPVVAAFNEANPDIKVVDYYVPTSEYSQKLLVALSGDADMDVWCCNNTSDYYNYYQMGQLYSLNDMLDLDSMPGIRYLTEQLAIDGDYACLPYSSSSWAIYYNKALFDKAGLPYPDGTWTWDEYREIARKLTYVEDGKQFYGNMTYPTGLGWWRIPALTKGLVNPLEPDVLAEFKATAQMTYDMSYTDMCQASYADRVGTAGSDYTGIFLQGQTAMMCNGGWAIAQLNTAIAEQGATFDYDIVELPHWEGYEPVTCGTCSVLVLNKNTKHPEEAYRFASFMAGEEGACVIAQNGNTPAYSSDKVTAAFMGDGVAVPANRGALLSREIVNMSPMDLNYAQALTIVREEAGLYLLQELTLDEAFANIEQRMKDEIER